MKVVRHQSTELAERLDTPAAALKGQVRRVLRNVGPLRSVPYGRAGCGQPGVDTADQIVGAGHAPHLGAENCGLQVKSQNAALGDHVRATYARAMPYDAEKIRRSIRRIQKEKKLKMSAWARKAGLGERTLAEFLTGNTSSPAVETLYAFADAAEVDVLEMLDIDPREADTKISIGAIRTMMALLERVEREQAGSGEALQSIRELARAISRELPRE